MNPNRRRNLLHTTQKSPVPFAILMSNSFILSRVSLRTIETPRFIQQSLQSFIHSFVLHARRAQGQRFTRITKLTLA